MKTRKKTEIHLNEESLESRECLAEKIQGVIKILEEASELFYQKNSAYNDYTKGDPFKNITDNIVIRKGLVKDTLEYLAVLVSKQDDAAMTNLSRTAEIRYSQDTIERLMDGIVYRAMMIYFIRDFNKS